MRKKEPKYFDEVRKMMLHISLTYGHNEFTYNSICEWLTQQGLVTILLSKVYHAGGLIKVRRGVYKLTNNQVDIEGLLKKMRVAYQEKLEVKPNNSPKLFKDITEDDAIAILKAKGYKILKPISQYEEI